MQTPFLNPIIDLERQYEKILKIRKYIAIKCHNTPDDNDSRSYDINTPFYRGESLEEWLKLKALDGKGISTVLPYAEIGASV